jgi:TonB family protein
MTWGVRRHTILLPARAHEWSADRRRLVLAHELAHVKRNDAIVHLFVQLASGMYWFNPLIWYAARRARIERERACDDRVLNLGGTAADYADHLVQIVRAFQAQKSFSFAALAMAQPSQLEARVISILDSRVRRRALSNARLVFLCALTVLITVSAARINLTGAVPLPPVLVVTTTISLETATASIPPQRARIGDKGAAPASTVVPPHVIGPTEPLVATVEGTITLEASVDAQGNIKVLRVIKGLGANLDQRAIAAASNWKFSPALKDGIPVATITQIDVGFTLPPGAFRAGGDVKPPTVLSRVEPQYTGQARDAHFQGTVVLEALIRKDGSVDILRVVQSAGYGLDESATEALKQWVFRPGMKSGEPVDVAINIEVNFNLK